MTREIVTALGKSREEKIALAARLKAELEEHLPELAAAREALVALGMMNPGVKAIRALKTPTIDYDVRRDNPDHDHDNWAKAPIITEEIRHEWDQLQARKIGEARAAQSVPERRGGHRRR